MSDLESSAKEVLLEAHNLTVRAEDRNILSGVSLQLTRRQIVTVIGPNGSGKTTLVRTVLGLQAPDSGEVSQKPGLRIGYVPQRIHVDETLPITVDRFLCLAKRSSRARRLEALAEVGAKVIVDTPVQKISGGEMRRVLLARALLRDPELLVLDEPSAGIDINGQADLYALIRNLRDQHNCGVLLVSHDLHLVMAATDHVMCLNHHVCCSGQPDDVSEHPEYLNLFGRDLSRTHAVYVHHHDHRHDLAGDPVEPAATKTVRGPDHG